MSTVKISVVGGVAYVDEVPPGVSVQVTDYDVDRAQATDVDEQGVGCSRYRVDADLLMRFRDVPVGRRKEAA